MLTRKLLVIALFFCFSSNIFASAFQLWEESADGTGDYHAGAAAEGRDVSDIYYNPALMSRFDKPEISAGMVNISLEANYTGTVQTFLTERTVSDVSGGTDNMVPNFHFSWPLSPAWSVGLEETTPFGLSTQYPDDGIAGGVDSLATETQLETYNLNPSIAYKMNQYFSIGLGFDAMYGSAIYNDTYLLFPIDNDLSGWGYGYNAGALVQFSPHTRIGLSYRSEIVLPATGPSSFYNAINGVTTHSIASTNFPLPATTMLSAYRDINDRFALMSSVFYTQWSIFKELIIHNIAQAGNPATVATNENYQNTWNFSIGALYKMTRSISIETCAGYDETPTQYYYRDIRLPDSNRYAASIGINVQPSPGFGWSMGYTHFFIDNIPINNSLSNNSQTTTSLPPAIGIGNVAADVNVFGIQFTWVI